MSVDQVQSDLACAGCWEQLSPGLSPGIQNALARGFGFTS
eukprot:SAG31_NODE_41393_length_276_cov_0.796610_1_plen_39_part_01